MRSRRWDLLQYDWYLCKKGKSGQRHAQKDIVKKTQGACHVKTEGETGVPLQKPREPKSGWWPPQARAAVSSTDLRGAWPSQQLDFGHLASGTVKWQISDVIISQPVSGTCYAVLVLLFGSYSVMSDSLRPRELQHTRLPCPSPSHGAGSNSCPLSQWCHPTISSSVTPFASCPQSFPASGSF